MSNAEYHSSDAVSRSFLWKLLTTTPLHAHYSKTHPDEPTAAMRVGTAAHLAVLEPDEFERTVVCPEISRRSRSGKRIVESYQDQGMLVLSRDEYECVIGMAEAIANHPVAKHMFRGGIAEATLFATDPRTGVRLKARYDYVLSNLAFSDLKTTDDASPRGFYYHALKFGYHVQAALYLRVAKLNGLEPKGFVFGAVEKWKPHAIACYHADEDIVRKGNADLDKSLDIYVECRDSGVWPGYPEYLMPMTMR